MHSKAECTDMGVACRNGCDTLQVSRDRYSIYSLHDRVLKKGVSFLRGNFSLSDTHVISMNVILPHSRREG